MRHFLLVLLGAIAPIALGSCSVYVNSLGYPSQLTGRNFKLYDPGFRENQSALLASSNLSVERFYYYSVEQANGRQGFSYLKFQPDGSFFTVFTSAPPSEMVLTRPIDDLGFIKFAGDSIIYEWKSNLKPSQSIVGTITVYQDRLVMTERSANGKGGRRSNTYYKH